MQSASCSPKQRSCGTIHLVDATVQYNPPPSHPYTSHSITLQCAITSQFYGPSHHITAHVNAQSRHASMHHLTTLQCATGSHFNVPPRYPPPRRRVTLHKRPRHPPSSSSTHPAVTLFPYTAHLTCYTTTLHHRGPTPRTY